MTNAYSGSLAWKNSFTRVTMHYRRIVFVVVNLAIALTLMEANMFDFLNTILGFYASCAMAWVITGATDIVVNKHLLGISPKVAEFRRGMLYPVNPWVSLSVLLSAGLSIVVFFAGSAPGCSPTPPSWPSRWPSSAPVLALATRGRLLPAPATDDGLDLPIATRTATRRAPSSRATWCHQDYERPDVTACLTHDDVVCSLCLSTDAVGDHVLPAAGAVPATGDLAAGPRQPLDEGLVSAPVNISPADTEKCSWRSRAWSPATPAARGEADTTPEAVALLSTWVVDRAREGARVVDSWNPGGTSCAPTRSCRGAGDAARRAGRGDVPRRPQARDPAPP